MCVKNDLIMAKNMPLLGIKLHSPFRKGGGLRPPFLKRGDRGDLIMPPPGGSQSILSGKAGEVAESMGYIRDARGVKECLGPFEF